METKKVSEIESINEENTEEKGDAKEDADADATEKKEGDSADKEKENEVEKEYTELSSSKSNALMNAEVLNCEAGKFVETTALIIQQRSNMDDASSNSSFEVVSQSVSEEAEYKASNIAVKMDSASVTLDRCCSEPVRINEDEGVRGTFSKTEILFTEDAEVIGDTYKNFHGSINSKVSQNTSLEVCHLENQNIIESELIDKEVCDSENSINLKENYTSDGIEIRIPSGDVAVNEDKSVLFDAANNETFVANEKEHQNFGVSGDIVDVDKSLGIDSASRDIPHVKRYINLSNEVKEQLPSTCIPIVRTDYDDPCTVNVGSESLQEADIQTNTLSNTCSESVISDTSVTESHGDASNGKRKIDLDNPDSYLEAGYQKGVIPVLATLRVDEYQDDDGSSTKTAIEDIDIPTDEELGSREFLDTYTDATESEFKNATKPILPICEKLKESNECIKKTAVADEAALDLVSKDAGISNQTKSDGMVEMSNFVESENFGKNLSNSGVMEELLEKQLVTRGLDENEIFSSKSEIDVKQLELIVGNVHAETDDDITFHKEVDYYQPNGNLSNSEVEVPSKKNNIGDDLLDSRVFIVDGEAADSFSLIIDDNIRMQSSDSEVPSICAKQSIEQNFEGFDFKLGSEVNNVISNNELKLCSNFNYQKNNSLNDDACGLENELDVKVTQFIEEFSILKDIDVTENKVSLRDTDLLDLKKGNIQGHQSDTRFEAEIIETVMQKSVGLKNANDVEMTSSVKVVDGNNAETEAHTGILPSHVEEATAHELLQRHFSKDVSETNEEIESTLSQPADCKDFKVEKNKDGMEFTESVSIIDSNSLNGGETCAKSVLGSKVCNRGSNALVNSSLVDNESSSGAVGCSPNEEFVSNVCGENENLSSEYTSADTKDKSNGISFCEKDGKSGSFDIDTSISAGDSKPTEAVIQDRPSKLVEIMQIRDSEEFFDNCQIQYNSGEQIYQNDFEQQDGDNSCDVNVLSGEDVEHSSFEGERTSLNSSEVHEEYLYSNVSNGQESNFEIDISLPQIHINQSVESTFLEEHEDITKASFDKDLRINSEEQPSFIMEVANVHDHDSTSSVLKILPEAISIPRSEKLQGDFTNATAGTVTSVSDANDFSPLTNSVSEHRSNDFSPLTNGVNEHQSLPTLTPAPLRQGIVTNVSGKIEVGLVTLSNSAKSSHSSSTDNSELSLIQQAEEKETEKTEKKDEPEKATESEEPAKGEETEKVTSEAPTPSVETVTVDDAEIDSKAIDDTPATTTPETESQESVPEKCQENVPEKELASENNEETATTKTEE